MKTSEEQLIQKIKSVFEDYDDHLAENGWAALREKYPEKQRKKLPIWWLSGIAATLLVVAGLYFYRGFEKAPIKLIAHQQDAKKTTTEETATTEPNKNNDTKVAEHDHNIAQTATAVIVKSKVTEQLRALQNDRVKRDEHEVKSETSNAAAALGNGQSLNAVNLNKVENNALAQTVANAATSAPAVTEKSEVLTPAADAIGSPKPVVKKSTADFLNEQSKLLAKEKRNEIKASESKTTFDVFTGTFFNYHDHNEAKLSAALGLNANFKVAKNVVLSVGAGISQNKVSYENKVPTEVTQSMSVSKSDVMSMAPMNVNYSATATNDVSFNGRLLSIDLPVAFKFFPTKKQDFYVSTGINSSTYLSQKYTYNYNLSNFGIQNGVAQPQQQTEESTLGGFDFANTAIIAIGFNQSLGKNILIFEPYYKPALNTMGNKNLRISSAGINLKFNFNGNTKK